MTNEAPQIRFEDGAAYESFMGVWSRKVGEQFLDWLAPQPGLAWLDVGCGNGAFTALLAERVRPSSILGVDPSPAQLDYARKRDGVSVARFEAGDAMALPADDNGFDAAAMALVIFFVPDPAKGVAEMIRAVKRGGPIAAYAWDMPGGGFPVNQIHDVLEEMGLPSPLPPSWQVSDRGKLEALWRDAGVRDVESRDITVERTFPDFETLWSISVSGPRLASVSASISPDQREKLKADVKRRLGAEDGKPITATARASAVKGIAPG